MTNLGSLLHSPGTHEFDSTGKKNAQLLELRTDTGAVYVRPSRWQRIRLRWIFRNFHVLPPQVLSGRDQRLIAKLAQSAVVTPTLPVASGTVFGVIEKVRAAQSAAADQVFVLTTVGTPASTDKSLQSDGGKTSWWNPRLGQLGIVGALAAICVTVILASALSSSSKPMRKPLAPTPAVTRVASAIKPIAPVTVSVASQPLASKAKRRPPEAAVARQEPDPLGASTFADRRQVSELPPGHFAHPIVAQRNLDGEVQFKALIGIDGSVKEVTVVRGDPRLAEAGVRALRQWHYRPYEEQGRPMEVETQVTMKFFGQDAVSIASVASINNESTSLLR